MQDEIEMLKEYNTLVDISDEEMQKMSEEMKSLGFVFNGKEWV